MSRFWAVSYLLLCISLTRCSNHGGNASVLREVSRGTAIFFIWLDDRFVVATDSMAAVNNGKSPPDYNDCKIDLQGKAQNFITVSGGLRRADGKYGPVDRRRTLNWDSQRFATQAYEASPTVAGFKEPADVASKWKEIALRELSPLPKESREALSRRLVGCVVLFAGVRSDGQLDVQIASVLYSNGQFDVNIWAPHKHEYVPLALGQEFPESWRVSWTRVSWTDGTGTFTKADSR
jgi:hypothetical protein